MESHLIYPAECTSAFQDFCGRAPSSGWAQPRYSYFPISIQEQQKQYSRISVNQDSTIKIPGNLRRSPAFWCAENLLTLTRHPPVLTRAGYLRVNCLCFYEEMPSGIPNYFNQIQESRLFWGSLNNRS